MGKTELERKKSYVENLASISGIDLSMLDWGSLLDLINLEIGFDISFRAFLDVFLNLDLHFDFSELDFHTLDFSFEFEPEFTKIPKAIYGKTKYGYCYYDPDQAGAKDLERLVWKWRKYAIETRELTYKNLSSTLKQLIANAKDALIAKGLKPEYLHAMEEKLALCAGKFFEIPYVGFAIVGLHKVAKPPHSTLDFTIKDPKNWETDITLKSVAIYENHVGYARVGYARVTSPYVVCKKSLGEYIKNEINAFRERVGVKEITGVFQPTYYGQPYPTEYKAKILNPRVFFLQRVEQLHYEGGNFQIQNQTMINMVKSILDEEGVMIQFRMAYISFANELSWLYHDSHKLWRRYKKIFTEEDLINKYISMGCNPILLNKIKEVVKR